MRPSLGRIVLYGLLGSEGTGAAPAIIVAVHDDTLVNLKVLRDGPADLWKPNVELGGLDATRPKPGCWIWPPRV